MKDKKSKSEATILMLSDSLNHINEKNIEEALKDYYLLETTYIGVIKKQKFDSVITQNKLNSLFNKYYYSSKDPNKIRERRITEKDIKKSFDAYLISPEFITLIDKLFADESEISYEMDKYSIIKGIHKTLSDKIIKTIQNTTNYNIIPNFLYYYDKKLLNYKVNDIIRNKYSFNYTDKNQNKIEYKYLVKHYQIFSQNPNIIFDIKLFNDEFRINLFKIIMLVNYNFFKNNIFAQNHFKERFINYMILIKIYDHYKELSSEFELIMKDDDKSNKEKLSKLTEYIKKELFSQENNNIKLDNNINNEITNSLKINKKYLKLIFSLSVLFNRIVIFKEINPEEKNQEEINIINIDDKKYEIKIVSKLKCSSISKHMLNNVLNIFEDEKSFLYNYMIDTYIYENIMKNNNRHLYLKNRDKEKIILNLQDILLRLDKSQNYKTEFKSFYNENKDIFNQPKLTVGFLGGLFGSKIPNSIKTEKGKEIYYNINDLKLLPVVKSDINSTQITIIIDGSLSNDILLISNNKALSHKDIFCSFFTNSIYTNSDFYCYDWLSINYDEISQSKKVSKFYGKLLAYIIISREIFSFQTINLVGYSMGCNVIKYCLLELNKLNKKDNYLDLINNIIFIGGCINIKFDKYPNIFESITGKIINVFSKADKDLFEYNKTAIGLSPLQSKDENINKNQIINIDLTIKNIKQNDYIYQIPNILFENSFLH
jgi:hypothetical protein